MENMTNLSKMTYEALDEAVSLLTAYKENGCPKDFWDEEVQIAYNENSGMVFLTNADYQVAVMGDNDELVSWYYCPYSGIEGTLEDLVEEYRNGNLDDEDDIEYLQDIISSLGEHSLYEDVFGVEEE